MTTSHNPMYRGARCGGRTRMGQSGEFSPTAMVISARGAIQARLGVRWDTRRSFATTVLLAHENPLVCFFGNTGPTTQQPAHSSNYAPSWKWGAFQTAHPQCKESHCNFERKGRCGKKYCCGQLGPGACRHLIRSAWSSRACWSARFGHLWTKYSEINASRRHGRARAHKTYVVT